VATSDPNANAPNQLQPAKQHSLDHHPDARFGPQKASTPLNVDAMQCLNPSSQHQPSTPMSMNLKNPIPVQMVILTPSLDLI
jgi:hypothetical protein